MHARVSTGLLGKRGNVEIVDIVNLGVWATAPPAPCPHVRLSLFLDRA